MTQHERAVVTPLYAMIEGRSVGEIVNLLWRERLLNLTEMERRYFVSEVERRVREGGKKQRAMADVAHESRCSFEKVRHAIYRVRTKK